ncbi:hypothetical protein EON65_46140 [archaeon]|nr:MAG: hypothetical protein EON65_46140 [archaeon]
MSQTYTNRVLHMLSESENELMDQTKEVTELEFMELGMLIPVRSLTSRVARGRGRELRGAGK